MVSTKEFKIVA